MLLLIILKCFSKNQLLPLLNSCKVVLSKLYQNIFQTIYFTSILIAKEEESLLRKKMTKPNMPSDSVMEAQQRDLTRPHYYRRSVFTRATPKLKVDDPTIYENYRLVSPTTTF